MRMIKESFTCKICGNNQAFKLFNENIFLLKCKNCKYVSKITEKFFSKNNFQDIVEHYSFNGSENIIDYILKNNAGESKIILDVGCWDGSLLNCLPKNWIKFGIEPNLLAADKARTKKNIIFNNQLKNFDFKDQKFDLILLLDVIEHLNDPLANLFKIHNILKPGGRFIILTGNTESFGCRLFKQNWYYFNYKSHISFFNSHNLNLMLENFGFQNILTIEEKHYTTYLRLLLKKVFTFKKRQQMKGINKIEFNNFSLTEIIVLLSRIIRIKDHILIKCEKV